MTTAYAPFGDVIMAAPRGEPGRSANQGTARRFNHVAPVVDLRPGAAGEEPKATEYVWDSRDQLREVRLPGGARTALVEYLLDRHSFARALRCVCAAHQARRFVLERACAFYRGDDHRLSRVDFGVG